MQKLPEIQGPYTWQGKST